MREIKVNRKPKSLIGMIVGLLVAAGLSAVGDKLGIEKENLMKFTILIWFGLALLFIIFVVIIAVTEKKRNFIADWAEYYLKTGRCTSKREALRKAREYYQDEKFYVKRYEMYLDQGKSLYDSRILATRDLDEMKAQNIK